MDFHQLWYGYYWYTSLIPDDFGATLTFHIVLPAGQIFYSVRNKLPDSPANGTGGLKQTNKKIIMFFTGEMHIGYSFVFNH